MRHSVDPADVSEEVESIVLCGGAALVEADRGCSGGIVAAINSGDRDTIGTCDILCEETTVDEEIAEEQCGLHRVVGERATIRGDRVVMFGVGDGVGVRTIRGYCMCMCT